MSDYGLIVKNSGGGIQIDATYRNLSLDSSGSASIYNGNSMGTTNGWYSTVSIDSSPLVPLILWRPGTDHFTSIRAYGKSGSNYTDFRATTFYGHSSTINWKCYRETRVASGDSYGLLVYNSSGDLCFDSGKKYFKIHSIHDISLGYPHCDDVQGNNDSLSFPGTTITHAAISNPYYILNSHFWWWFSSKYSYEDFYHDHPGSWQYLNTVGLKKISSTSVNVGWFLYCQNDQAYTVNNTGYGINPTAKLIVCDVA